MANIEAMWAARCLKFHALAIKKLMESQFEMMGLGEVRETFTITGLNRKKIVLSKASAWDLLNIPIDEDIDMFDRLLAHCKKYNEDISFDDLFGHVKANSMEQIGVFDFIESMREFLEESSVTPSTGKWFISGSRHYSWDKGANILGFGRSNLEKVSVDKFCTINTTELKEKLEICLEKKIPVVGVTAGRKFIKNMFFIFNFLSCKSSNHFQSSAPLRSVLKISIIT